MNAIDAAATIAGVIFAVGVLTLAMWHLVAWSERRRLAARVQPLPPVDSLDYDGLWRAVVAELEYDDEPTVELGDGSLGFRASQIQLPREGEPNP